MTTKAVIGITEAVQLDVRCEVKGVYGKTPGELQSYSGDESSWYLENEAVSIDLVTRKDQRS